MGDAQGTVPVSGQTSKSSDAVRYGRLRYTRHDEHELDNDKTPSGLGIETARRNGMKRGRVKGARSEQGWRGEKRMDGGRTG
jgi:hypothetical protein